MDSLRRMSQEQRRMVLCPALDYWSLGCTSACLAWSAAADPPLRSKITLADWGCTQARNRDLARVAPRGSPLRPVLDMMLHMDPDERGRMPQAITHMLDRVGPE